MIVEAVEAVMAIVAVAADTETAAVDTVVVEVAAMVVGAAAATEDAVAVVVVEVVAGSRTSLFPCRPSYGNAGRAIVVWANHFQVDLNVNRGDIFHYDVVFCKKGDTPLQAVPKKELCVRVLKALIKELKSELPAITVVSDARRNIYASAALPFNNRMIVVKEVFDSGKSKEWDVYVKAADPVAIPMHQVEEFFAGRLNFTPYDAIMALDIALRATANNKFVSAGRNFYTPSNKVALGEGADLWFGYHQSLRPTQTRLTLNIDIAAATFIKKMDLIEYVTTTAFGGRQARFDDPQAMRAASRAVKGVLVRVTHRGNLNQEFKINGLTTTPANATFFTTTDGTQHSVAAYFEATYYKLKHPEWPCAQTGSKSSPQFLPMEVCFTPGTQKSIRKETPMQVATIIKQTCTPPYDRRQKIEAQVAEAHFENDGILAAFGLNVTQKMMAVEARQLPDPELEYLNQAIERPRDGSWNMRGKGFYEGMDLDSFAILNLGNPNDDRGIVNFFNKLVDQLGELKMRGPRGAAPPLLTRTRNQSVEDLFGEAVRAAEKVYGKPPRVVFCVNGGGDSANYADLKRASDVNFGIPSQCMLAKHVGKASPQYIANLMLKVNMKLGGRNVVCRGALPKISECPTIIFGADVTHPVSIDKSKPSISSVVATMDRFASHHAACVRKQGHRVEHIEDMEGITNELLRSFYQATHVKPERILIYRDGISEGQFQNILSKEVQAIRQACESLEPGYRPAITFVVVQKRHHTRIFPTAAMDADRSGNCKAGTVVDTGICHPTEHDFYLMSHSGLQGCSRPAHYHVLMDEIGFAPNELQTLTYHLCYTFARCTRAVSVVPACYYSHLVAERARLFLIDGSSDGGSTVDGNFVESTGRILDVHGALARVMYYL
ncbi:hypothetical protein H257_00397 [Aphanomyces astaci]|uniref:Piwi domain-containing protein n=1 Tax=Aphanomyces astaci TaxID=112090 RepID=W4HCG2_APHAT|nr:hypothetical protein H257_00397 [Aphanomyces astaci]ETV88979.1 hypothetical protein H257_00397 [Aphanomyces astaci]|eukprot:XP_009821379.1 hypothetical protein H257_00397 [Aphanomyces astaci]